MTNKKNSAGTVGFIFLAMLMAKVYGINAYSSPTPDSRYITWKTKLPFHIREEFYYIGYKVYKILPAPLKPLLY